MVSTAPSPSMSTAVGFIVPHSNDVLLGRGGNNNKHIGNEQLRLLAKSLAAEYSKASKKQKSNMSRDIVRHIRNLTPPGRFLRKSALEDQWEDAGDAVAREKVSQALRDAVSSKLGGSASVEGIATVSEQEDHDPTETTTESLPNISTLERFGAESTTATVKMGQGGRGATAMMDSTELQVCMQLASNMTHNANAQHVNGYDNMIKGIESTSPSPSIASDTMSSNHGSMNYQMPSQFFSQQLPHTLPHQLQSQSQPQPQNHQVTLDTMRHNLTSTMQHSLNNHSYESSSSLSSPFGNNHHGLFSFQQQGGNNQQQQQISAHMNHNSMPLRSLYPIQQNQQQQHQQPYAMDVEMSTTSQSTQFPGQHPAAMYYNNNSQQQRSTDINNANKHSSIISDTNNLSRTLHMSGITSNSMVNRMKSIPEMQQDSSSNNSTKSVGNDSRYKYYGEILRRSCQQIDTASIVENAMSRRHSITFPTNRLDTQHVIPSVTFAQEDASRKSREVYFAEQVAAPSASHGHSWHQRPSSSIPSLYQHIQERTRIRNGSARVSQHSQAHFNDRSSIGRSSMGGIETISNFSSNLSSEANFDPQNFDWLGQPTTEMQVDMS